MLTAIKIASANKSDLFILHDHVYNHMAHVVKIDILTCHEKIDNLHFILNITFHCMFIDKSCIFSKREHLRL